MDEVEEEAEEDSPQTTATRAVPSAMTSRSTVKPWKGRWPPRVKNPAIGGSVAPGGRGPALRLVGELFLLMCK